MKVIISFILFAEGIRAYCSESDSVDENDSEHQAKTPSHELTLQRDPDKTIHVITLSSHV